jgi:hypothetical protein
MEKVKTYFGRIFIGLKEGYDGTIFNYDELKKFIKENINLVGAVNVVRNEFIYIGGEEPGVIVETINYPRFPATEQNIKKTTLKFAALLKNQFKQYRVSVMFPDETIMLGEK